MTPRAAPMPPQERRQSILAAVVPLLAERGADLSTKEIADAAGIAEGTIFRVFEDKRSLMLAAAREAINPADGEELFDAALHAAPDLRSKILVVVGRVQERMRLTMAVMVAVRRHLIDLHHEQHADPKQMGPPPFVLEAQRALHERLTRLFQPHADELALTPEHAAVALRSLVIGASRSEMNQAPSLTPEEIADVLLHGVLKRED